MHFFFLPFIITLLLLLQKSNNSDNTKITEENYLKPSIDWESKFFDKEKEWKEKERTYVTDLLKQTKELQEVLAQVEGRKNF